MTLIANYLAEQLSGTKLLQDSLVAIEQALLSQNTALLNKLQSTTNIINNLQNQSCPSQNIAAAPSSKGPRWHINMDNVSSINDIDLEQCSPLTLKEFNITLPKVSLSASSIPTSIISTNTITISTTTTTK
jgi:hypothetical protein